MRLAVVTDCLSRNAGGLFHGVLRLAQEVRAAGCDVSAFGVADDQLPNDRGEWQPIEPRDFPLAGPRAFGYARGLIDAIRAEKPDVIELHGLWKFTSLAALRASRALKCPTIIHPHGMLDPWAVRNSGWKKTLAAWGYERRNLQRTACIRALNRQEADAVRAYGLRNPICIVPNGIDIPSPFQTSRVASPFPVGKRILLFLGRIHPKKNLLSLLEGWSLYQSGGATREPAKQWTLAVAGWDQGGHLAELQRRAAELRLGETVQFLGPRFGTDKAACYAHCDAFILPSLSEGLPIVVLEAWSHGKPALITAACNLPDGVDAGAALPINATAEGICQGLAALCKMSAGARAAMGCRGQALVLSRYTWRNAAQQMRLVYEWVVHGGSPPEFVEFA
jgi:poly(glycerol-phosphate) alpha-glucosyltransferase